MRHLYVWAIGGDETIPRPQTAHPDVDTSCDPAAIPNRQQEACRAGNHPTPKGPRSIRPRQTHQPCSNLKHRLVRRTRSVRAHRLKRVFGIEACSACGGAVRGSASGGEGGIPCLCAAEYFAEICSRLRHPCHSANTPLSGCLEDFHLQVDTSNTNPLSAKCTTELRKSGAQRATGSQLRKHHLNRTFSFHADTSQTSRDRGWRPPWAGGKTPGVQRMQPGLIQAAYN